MTMKRLLITLSVIFSAVSLWAQNDTPVWLTSLTPTEQFRSHNTNEDHHGPFVLGGIEYQKGFEIGSYSSLDRKEYGYIEYDLEGKYRTLSFIYGIPSPTQAPDRRGIMVVTADGKKVIDKIISTDDGNCYMTLDVEGVHKLRFAVASTEVDYGIAMPALWKEGQTPRCMGRLTEGEARPTMLCRDLMPANKGHKVFSSNKAFYDRGIHYEEAEEGEIRLSGNVYKDGLWCNTEMALIGNRENFTYFNLGGMYGKMKFTVGPVDTDDGTIGRGWLTIEADRKIIYEKEIIEGELAQDVILNIKGCHSLRFKTEQAEGSLDIGIANIMVYPEGYSDETIGDVYDEPFETIAQAPEYLKGLPDQCKLVSNIPPFAFGGGTSRNKAVFDDKSQHITFSMGGVKFSEGIVLQSSTNFFHNNTGAHCLFNLGGEFDYVSFTTGWVGICGVLKNDWLRVYADDALILQVELVATDPNRSYLLPINKCKVLKFEKVGMSSMSHPAFGLADMVVYRGEPKLDHGLFPHPVPDFPDQIDLIDLNLPYIHYVSSAMDVKRLFDGTSQKEYFSMPNGERIHKGFLLKTSVHFDLEMGPLSNPSAGIMSPMLGSSVMIGSAGGATISAVSSFGALLMLAAGGTAHESSCAAFNTWGQYDILTFTVACRLPHNTIDTIDLKQDPMETLLIGADKEVVAEIQIHDKMEPTTYSVPINKCHQLMFWLECGGSGSGQFIFYDLKLSKDNTLSMVQAPNVKERNNRPNLLTDAGQFDINYKNGLPEMIEMEWPDSYPNGNISEYKKMFNDNMTMFDEFIENLMTEQYITVCRQVAADDGQTWRSFRLQSPTGEKFSYLSLVERNKQIISIAKGYKFYFATLTVSRTAALAGLLDMDPMKIREWRLALKESGEILKQYQSNFEALIKAKEEENKTIGRLIDKAVTLDGIESTEIEIFVK